jgi:hypothetical protein
MQNTLTVFKGVLIGLAPYLFLLSLSSIIRLTMRGQVMELGGPIVGIVVLFMWAMLIEFFVGIGLLFSSTRRSLGVSMIAIILLVAVLFVEGHLYMPS